MIKLKLDTNAVSALIAEDPEISLEIGRAVAKNIIARLYGHDYDALTAQMTKATTAEVSKLIADDETFQKTLSEVAERSAPTVLSRLDSKYKKMFNEELRKIAHQNARKAMDAVK